MMIFTKRDKLMMEAAEDLQELWEKKEGDYWMKRGPARSEKGEQMQITEDWEITNIDFKIHKAIWLPTQKQLQELSGVEAVNFEGALVIFHDYHIKRFCKWISDWNMEAPFCGIKYRSRFDTMEQLWLAYYMFEQHLKMWDGKEWITQEEYHAKNN